MKKPFMLRLFQMMFPAPEPRVVSPPLTDAEKQEAYRQRRKAYIEANNIVVGKGRFHK